MGSFRIFEAMRTLTTGLFLLLISLTQGQGVLKLINGDVPLMDGSYATLPLTGEEGDYDYYRIVVFHEVPNADQKADLLALGIELFDYLPEHAYFASVRSDITAVELEEAGIRAMSYPTDMVKLHPDLYVPNYPEWALDGKSISLSVRYYPDIESDEFLNVIERFDAEILEHFEVSNRAIMTVAIDQLESLTTLPAVKYIEPIDPPAEPENLPGRTNGRSNTLAMDRWFFGRQYNGSGINVAMGDDDMIGPHIDYEGRIDQSHVTGNSGDHGDHVAGTIMGAGNLDPTTRGMGWGSFLWVYSVWDAVEESPTSYFTEDVRLTSTSYSNGCNAGYTSFALDADQYSRLYPSLLHVFSAGNSGTSDCGYGAGSNWGNVTGGVKIGKNVIAVANLNYLDQLQTSSSRGPAHDGRIKPDISAVGTNVYSTIDVNTYDYKTGTSMSCPLISGTLSQLYQAYRDLNGGMYPDNALMKAILLNTADDIGNVGPDFKHGWGRVNGLHAVELLEQGNFLLDSVDNANTNNHTISLSAPVDQLKIMVYWTDYEGAESASVALVNDLDMTVTDPSVVTHLPYLLDHTPAPANLDLPAGNGADHLNNVEQVVILNAGAGNYSVDITGFNVPQGPQPYYIVWQVINEGVEVTYPMAGESLEPGYAEVIRWDAMADTGTFAVDFSADGGSTWSVINTGVPGNQRHLNWTTPDTMSGNCLIRVSRGATSDVSDVPFNIVGVPQNITVNWICPDSISISWDPVVKTSGYVVWVLGTTYMDSTMFTPDTFAVVPGTGWTTGKWISVSSIGADGAFGKRAIAVQTPIGLLNCVLPIDLEVVDVTSPADGTQLDCFDLTQVTVSALITNTGTSPITNPTINYLRSPGGTLVSETYTGTLNTGDTIHYVFTQTQDVSIYSTYDIDVWVAEPGDSYTLNDTSTAMIRTLGGTSTTVTPPYSENFASFAVCAEASDCEDINCSMAWGWKNEPNYTFDDVEWRVDLNGTPSTATGPSVDYDPGTSTGKYAYIEASSCFGREALLLSPCIDLSGSTNPELQFAYHMHGAAMGELHVDIKSGHTYDLDVMPVVSGPQGGLWQVATIDLSAYAGQMIQVRWRGITGTASTSDMAIDAVRIDEATDIDESSAGQFQLYPNPADGSVTIQFSAAVDGTLQLIDMVGKVIQSETLNGSIGVNEWDVSELETGMYLITYINEEGSSTSRKLLINH